MALTTYIMENLTAAKSLTKPMKSIAFFERLTVNYDRLNTKHYG